MRSTNYLQKIKANTPDILYTKISGKFPMMYIHREQNVSYRGYDVSDVNPTNPVAEVILYNDKPVQVRFLTGRPFWAEDLKFGEF